MNHVTAIWHPVLTKAFHLGVCINVFGLTTQIHCTRHNYSSSSSSVILGLILVAMNASQREERSEKQKAIDEWLPITSSRNAKWWYSAFHNVTAMVGAGVLSLPYAMSELGWYVSPLFSFSSINGFNLVPKLKI